MGAARKKADETWQQRPPSRPPLSREAQQARMENLAMKLAEKQMETGEASAQVITHYLKSASTKGKLEEMKIQYENELLQAKKKQIESAEHLQNLFVEAMQAFSVYRIEPTEDDAPPPQDL